MFNLPTPQQQTLVVHVFKSNNWTHDVKTNRQSVATTLCAQQDNATSNLEVVCTVNRSQNTIKCNILIDGKCTSFQINCIPLLYRSHVYCGQTLTHVSTFEERGNQSFVERSRFQSSSTHIGKTMHICCRRDLCSSIDGKMLRAVLNAWSDLHNVLCSGVEYSETQDSDRAKVFRFFHARAEPRLEPNEATSERARAMSCVFCKALAPRDKVHHMPRV